MSKSGERPIGYWRDAAEAHGLSPAYPLPVANTASPTEAALVTQFEAFLKANATLTHAFGSSTCRLCGRANGCGEYTFSFGKVDYVVPDGYFHYLRDHNVAIDPVVAEIIKIFKLIAIFGNRSSADNE